MARGGARQGKPGTAYSNRTDLNQPKPAPVMRIPGQEYGAQAAQVAQQQQVQEWTPPAAPTPLDAPTMRPDEPVTHGLPSGPGAGPEVLDLDEGDEVLTALRAAYDAFPTTEMLRLLLDEEERRGV